MKRRIKARTGLVISACFALQLTPASLSSTASADVARSSSYALPQNRLAYADAISDNPLVLTHAKANVDARNYARFINKRIRELLPDDDRWRSERVAQVLIEEANRHKMDPLFLMAMIEHESQFRPDALGSHGEIGLMQVKPSTATWLAFHHARGIKGLRSTPPPEKVAQLLRNPIFNIRCGTAYLAVLASSFHNHHELYLTAYNQGPGTVHTNLRSRNPSEALSTYRSVYSIAVMNNYRILALEFLNEAPSLSPAPMMAEANHVALLLARASVNDLNKPGNRANTLSVALAL